MKYSTLLEGGRPYHSPHFMQEVGSHSCEVGNEMEPGTLAPECRTETTASHQLISIMNEIGSAFEGEFYQVDGGHTPAHVQHGATVLVAQRRGMQGHGSEWKHLHCRKA